jgi:hypothetical protein
MTERSVLEENARRVLGQMPEGGLFHEKEWRVGPEPFVLPEGFASEVESLGVRLHKFVRACNLLYLLSWKGRMPGWIAQLLDAGKPAEVVALGREAALRQKIPSILRPDVILTPQGFVLAEIDNVPGGIGLTGWLNQTYADLGYDVVGGRDGMLEGFGGLFARGGRICLSEEAATYRPEMEWMVGQLGQRGVKVELGAPESGGVAGESTYRFF